MFISAGPTSFTRWQFSQTPAKRCGSKLLRLMTIGVRITVFGVCSSQRKKPIVPPTGRIKSTKSRNAFLALPHRELFFAPALGFIGPPPSAPAFPRDDAASTSHF
jgi:hypothetical protein